jgi:hypothetical protein
MLRALVGGSTTSGRFESITSACPVGERAGLRETDELRNRIRRPGYFRG